MKIDRYEVMRREDGSIHRLGQGATSSSYKALDVDLRTPVVLKVMREEFLRDETARKRFLREARAAAMLRHPNVAMIYRLGDEGDMTFYAREFIEGETAEAIVNREGPLSLERGLDVALQVARALVAVKKMNLVHRDIKPSNLMITPDGTVKIIDFGLARGGPGGEVNGLESITLSGFVGTPDYASPEQLNEENLEVTSDIYSLGVTLWFLLVGKPPYRGPMAQVMAQHLQSPPPFEEIAHLPRRVITLLAHMLEKDPAKRPAAPALLVSDIEACLASLKTPATAPAPDAALALASSPVALSKVSASRTPTRDRPRSSAMAEALLGVVLAAIIYFVLSRPVETPPAQVKELPRIESTVAVHDLAEKTLP